MKARYQFRFYPTDQQQQLLAQLFGCVRVVWNDALAICKQKELLPSKKLGSPKFKKKTNQQTARFRIGGFSIKGDEVYLAKIGNISPIWSRELPSSPTSVTVIKDCANRYFLSFVVETEPIHIDAKNQSIGIDLGIKTFAFMSNGETAKSPDYSRLDKRLRRKQRQLARQVKGSKRREVTRLQIAKLHNQISDIRKDFLHKLSTKIVSVNQALVLEDLNVSGMVKNRKLSRVISLQGWREFRTLCEAKSAKYDRTFHVISRWEPTSQVCSECGYKWGKLDLKVRLVQCLNCGTEHERDGNAAKNIEKVGMGNRHDSKRTQRNYKTISVAESVEASRITEASAR
jgi:putative transposase